MNARRDVRNRIQSFIDNQLENCIKADQKKCRILSEFDLQVSVNRCLRKYFKSEAIKDWYILNEHYFRISREIRKTKRGKKLTWVGYTPDIVIVHKKKAGKVLTEFILELKEFKNPSPPSKLSTGLSHDLNKMVRSLKKIKKIQTTHDTNLQCYIIWCVSEPHRSFDPKEIQELMRDYIQNRIKKRRMKIEPIVINAFYNNRKPSYKIKRGTDNSSQRLKNKQKVGLNPQIDLIRKLKKLQL